MRKALLLAYISLVFLTFPTYVHSSEWMQVEYSPGGEKNYIDLGSITYKKPLVTFWTKNIDRKGEMTKTSYYINCKAGIGAIKDIIIYDSDETVVKAYTFEEHKLQWSKISPRSFMHAFFYTACESKTTDINR
jgi:hypothetical protein